MRTPGAIVALAWTVAVAAVKNEVQSAYAAYFLAASTGAPMRLPQARHFFDRGGDIVFLASGLGMLVGQLFLMTVMARYGERASSLWRCTVPPRSVALWMLAAVAWLAAGDLALWLLEGRVTDAGTVELYRTTTAPWMALFQVVVIAPIFEESLVRGFLLPHLAARMGGAWAVVATAVLWALAHTQYGALDMALVAAQGLLLGVARLRTGGIVVPVMIHMLGNVWASAEIAWVLRH